MNVMAKRGKSAAQVVLATISGELSSVVGGKPHWIAVANSVEDIRRSGNWQPEFESPTAWLEAAAKASGYTTNTIRRFIAAVKFLERKGSKTEKYLLDPFCGGGRHGLEIGHIELIKRVDDISPTTADLMLDRLDGSGITFRDIKKQYDELVGRSNFVVVNPPYSTSKTISPEFAKLVLASVDAGKLGLRRSHQDKRTVKNIVQREISRLSDSNAAKVFADRYKFDFVAPDVVAVGQEDYSVSFVDAFELKKLSKHSPPNTVRKAVGEIAFASTFFRRYWVLLENGSDAGALLNEAFDTLKISSVGIATVDLAEVQEIEILRRPSAPPTPDRHDIARSSILSQGIPA